MRMARVVLESCGEATDLVVAIDVIRAFTTSAYLFSAGVEEIFLVSEVDEAFSLREKMPGCLISGEVRGVKVNGFDFGNSPSEFFHQDLSGKRVIQRTSAGTQGVVRSVNAKTVLAAALTNASATARYIQKVAPATTTFVLTGIRIEDGWGDEDAACADAIEDLLCGNQVEWDKVIHRVRNCRSGLFFDGTDPDFPPQDLDLVLQANRFDFAMLVERSDHLHRMRAIVME
jgi:2-phosphosulfolactate phosphatase